MNRQTGGAIGEREHISQSVTDILSTRIGTRVMRREYPPVLRDIATTGVIGAPGREHTIDTLDIYPPVPGVINLTCYIGAAGREHSIDTLDIYP